MSNPVHHVELWTHDLAATEPAWHWLMSVLGWPDSSDPAWAAGRTWTHASGASLVLEQSPDVHGTGHDRLAPGLNHLAFRVPDRQCLDELRQAASSHGWTELFADRYPHAGGRDHTALFLQNAQGFEVEIVAEARAPWLLVLAGLPGVGKTTLGRAVARSRGATFLRVDAAETALQRFGELTGPEGYAVVHELAASNLQLGHDVVVDVVNPLAIARTAWAGCASSARARLLVVELQVPDRDEHRRRVTTRAPDLAGQVVPTWEEVRNMTYQAWDEARDGPRLLVDATDADEALARVLRALDDRRHDG